MADEITKDEFCRRFKAHMLKVGGDMFDDGTYVAEYADQTAPTYWDDKNQRDCGPEECAEEDISCWGED